MSTTEANKVREAIILAGGLGTRLREAVPDLPKCMATVADRPFIAHVIDYLRRGGIERMIFSLGYKSEVIEQYLQQHYPTLDYAIALEEEPLGTGGAIRLALQQAKTSHVLVANGDTLFRADIGALSSFHLQQGAECSLALKPMKEFERYGVVEKDGKGRITQFREKQYYREGLINGGLYLVDRDQFGQRNLPQKFSFEKDYLEAFYSEGRFYGLEQEGYFIDIGIPEDYRQAQADLQRKLLNLSEVDESWTLFLDRDGVINDERVGYYVLHWGEFIFSKGVLEVFKKLSDQFGRILVVSNQRGVGKGLMTEEALQSIHLEMQREVGVVGGHIEQIYYCTDKDDKSFYRKPNPGMAIRAFADFPQIDPDKTIMVGNKPSDMKFGRAAGVYTVFVTTTNPDQAFPHPDIDLIFPSLEAFAGALKP